MNKDKIKEYMKAKGLKMYQLSDILGLSESTVYHVYLYNSNQDKYEKVRDAIDDYTKAK